MGLKDKRISSSIISGEIMKLADIHVLSCIITWSSFYSFYRISLAKVLFCSLHLLTSLDCLQRPSFGCFGYFFNVSNPITCTTLSLWGHPHCHSLTSLSGGCFLKLLLATLHRVPSPHPANPSFLCRITSPFSFPNHQLHHTTNSLPGTSCTSYLYNLGCSVVFFHLNWIKYESGWIMSVALLTVYRLECFSDVFA